MGLLWGAAKKVVADDSMSIALFSLFLVSLAGQSLSGWFAYNGALQAGHFDEIAFGAYLGAGNFLDGMFSNWEAAVLQLAALIAFGSVLRQKGAAHSRKADALNHRTLEWKWGRRATAKEWIYANSLSLAFFGMFAATFMLHAVWREEVQRGSGAPASAAGFARLLCRFVQLLVLGVPVLGGGIFGHRRLYRAHHLPAAGSFVGVQAGRRKQ